MIWVFYYIQLVIGIQIQFRYVLNDHVCLNIIGVLITTLFLRHLDIGVLYLYLTKLGLLLIYFYSGMKSDIITIKTIKNTYNSFSHFFQNFIDLLHLFRYELR